MLSSELKTLLNCFLAIEVQANQISKWKQEFLSRSSEIFSKPAPEKQSEKEMDRLYAKIGKLEVERDWLKKISSKAGL